MTDELEDDDEAPASAAEDETSRGGGDTNAEESNDLDRLHKHVTELQSSIERNSRDGAYSHWARSICARGLPRGSSICALR